MIRAVLCKIKSVILHEEKDRLPFFILGRSSDSSYAAIGHSAYNASA